MNEDEISNRVIGAAIEVHRIMGPGLLESVYQKCLCRELELQGIMYEAEAPLNVSYKGENFEGAYRLDLLVSDLLIVELKVVEKILPVHEAQLLSYLRLTGMKLGLLINFHVPQLKQGIKRIVNGL